MEKNQDEQNNPEKPDNQNTPTAGGEDSNYISEDLIVNKDYYNQLSTTEMLTCPICLGLLNNPLMCESCQNSFCSKCLTDWEKKHLSCPYKCEKRNFVPINRTLKTLLDGLLIKCSCGCEQNISLLQYPAHKEQFQKISCFNCGTAVLKSNLKYPNFKIEDSPSKLFKTVGNLDAKLFKEFSSKISFLIFLEANDNKGFITYKDGKMYLTKYRPDANFFSAYFYNKQKFLQVFLSKGWRFVEPHYDRGVIVGNSPSDSINFDFDKGTITSNSGRTKGSPLTVRIWDNCLYFYYTDVENYVPARATFIPNDVYS